MGDPIVEALEGQLGYYRRLAKLAELQHVHVQQDQTEALIDVLKSRQGVLDDIKRLEHVIGPAKRDWNGYAGKVEPEIRTRAETLLAETRAILEQITTSDQNDAMVLQQRKLNLGKQISQTSSARQLNRSYAAAAYGTPMSRMDIQR